MELACAGMVDRGPRVLDLAGKLTTRVGPRQANLRGCGTGTTLTHAGSRPASANRPTGVTPPFSNLTINGSVARCGQIRNRVTPTRLLPVAPIGEVGAIS